MGFFEKKLILFLFYNKNENRTTSNLIKLFYKFPVKVTPKLTLVSNGGYPLVCCNNHQAANPLPIIG